jgi:hypothetical protein
MDALKLERQLDLKTLIGQDVQVLQAPEPATAAVSVEQASAVAGYPLRLPKWLPRDARVVEISVTNEGLARVTADTARVDELLDALGITDLRAPSALDRQVVTLRVPRGVVIGYEHGGGRTRFYQAPAPEVTMPSGVPLVALGEIGLRILGVPDRDARRLAAAIDWSSTLLVPISSNVRSVFEVSIDGHRGLVMEYMDGSQTHMVLWSDGERVYALISVQEFSQVLEMANSVR